MYYTHFLCMLRKAWRMNASITTNFMCTATHVLQILVKQTLSNKMIRLIHLQPKQGSSSPAVQPNESQRDKKLLS